MENISELEYLSLKFNDFIGREELLKKKYDFFLDHLEIDKKSENKALIDTIKEFRKVTRQHVKTLKNQTIQLSLKR